MASFQLQEPQISELGNIIPTSVKIENGPPKDTASSKLLEPADQVKIDRANESNSISFRKCNQASIGLSLEQKKNETAMVGKIDATTQTNSSSRDGEGN